MRSFAILLLVGLVLTLGCSKDETPTTPTNHAPSITSVTASPDSVGLSGSTTVSCVATDADSNTLTYSWSCPQGTFPNGAASASVVWQAPNTVGSYTVQVTVSDGAETASSSVTVKVGVPRAGIISGMVTAASSGNPIVGATITTQPATTSTTTDGQGRYTLFDVPPASYTVSASKAGYTEDSVEVVVTAGNTVTADIALSVSQGSHAGEERDFPMGNTTIRMCWIPAGSFMMGRMSGEQDSESNEDPRHQVTFAQGFWMGKYEITQAQWQAVMGSNPASNYGVGSNFPVYYVPWNNIQVFEQTLGGLFRLPSEAEWEYACRAGTTTRFFWGDDPSYSQIGTYAWYWNNSISTTHPVGQKTPNAWGLCDMTGNLWEYCEDRYHDSYNGAPSDGSAWVVGVDQKHVVRGNSWLNYGKYCRSAFRSKPYPSNSGNMFGFRVAADFPSP